MLCDATIRFCYPVGSYSQYPDHLQHILNTPSYLIETQYLVPHLNCSSSLMIVSNFNFKNFLELDHDRRQYSSFISKKIWPVIMNAVENVINDNNKCMHVTQFFLSPP